MQEADFWDVVSFVSPARTKYSLPESVVGMVVSGIVGREMCAGGLGTPRAYVASYEGVEMAFARH